MLSPVPELSRAIFVALLLAGLALRLAGFTSAGTEDVSDFGVWMRAATMRGATHVYGFDRWPPAVRTLEFDGYSTSVDYPPAAVYVLSATGHVYRVLAGDFDDLASTVIPIKIITTAASAGVAALLWVVGRRHWGDLAARVTSAAFWVNPAAILHSAVLGYIGPLAALPAIGALAAAEGAMAWTAGGLFALSVLTKPQGVLVGPGLVFALMRRRDLAAAQTARLVAGGAIIAAILVLPFAASGAFTSMSYAIYGLVTDDSLSAHAANVWWLLAYALRVARHLPTDGLAAALVHARILDIDQVLPLDQPFATTTVGALVVRAASWCCVAIVVGWAMWRAHRASVAEAPIAVAALTVNAYFMFAVGVHENHMSLILPLLTLLAVRHPRYRGVLAASSVVIFLNLYLFEGLGDGLGPWPSRYATDFDWTVVLAAANVLVFAWHAREFARFNRP